MVKKVIMNLDLSRASGPDCIPVVVLKDCEPELSYIYFYLYLIRYLRSMFTIVKKLIYIDNKKEPNKMKKLKSIKWVGAGRYMSNIPTYSQLNMYLPARRDV